MRGRIEGLACAVMVGLTALARGGGAPPAVLKATWAESMAATRARLSRSAPVVAETERLPFDTGSMPGTAGAVRVSVNVAGVQALRLVGLCEEGVANCHVWGEPRLIDRGGRAVPLTSLVPASVRVGWGRLIAGSTNWQGHALRIGDRTFGDGLWVHADSEVRYALGGQYARLEAWVGEDADRAVGVARFQVLEGEDESASEHWMTIAREFPVETGWLIADLGRPKALRWFDARADAALEEGLLGRVLEARGEGGSSLRKECDELVARRAPPGDVRWLDLYARACRHRETAAILERMEEGPDRAALREEMAELTAARTPPGDRAWSELRHRAMLRAEVAGQYEMLASDLARRAAFDRIADQAHRRDALILPSDRDPLDVVLRRALALLEHLRRAGAGAKLAAPAERLAGLHRAADRTPVTQVAARRTLFDEACAVRREIAFANPLLDFDRLLFIKRHRALFNHMCDQFYGMAATPGGGLFILSDPFGAGAPAVRDVLARSVVERGRLKGERLSGGPLTAPALSFDGMGNLRGDAASDGGSFLSPALSYDARRIAFAYVEGRGDRNHVHHTDASRGHWAAGRCYHLFGVNADGTGLVQLTDGTWNDFDPCWLPNGRIAFISERRGGYLRCGRVCPLYTLYDMAADGSGVNCLSFHESNEWNPSVTHDGRIIFTRWDYVDRHGCAAHHPWITTLDGTDSRALHGNFSVRPQRADMELGVRAVPGSTWYTATAAPHHGQAFGSLVLINPARPDDDAMGPVRRLTPDVAFPESQGGAEAYGTPWPLSPDFHLCVYDPDMAARREARGGRGAYGIYLVDGFGNKEMIYRDPDIGCLTPIPVRPRPAPPPTPAPGYGTLAGAPAEKRGGVAPGDRGEATLAVVNVYESLKPWPEGTRIEALRVLQVLPMSVPSGGPPHDTGMRIAGAGDSVVPVRWVLGTVPVEQDGSAHFTVPAYRELFFQALDGRGLAVQSMRSATYLRAGERLTCAGCHEPKAATPSAQRANPLAMRRPPSAPAPDVDGTLPFSYPRLVQPVLDRNCVACHQQNREKAPNLGREPIQRNWFASYHTLVRHAFTDYNDGYRTTPGRFGARASRLLEMLDRGHHDLRLSPEDFHRLTVWMDCASMFYGVFEKEGGEAQLRGELAGPTLW